MLTLAIGIGTTTGLYALARVLLADLPGVPEIWQLARIYASSPSLDVERSPVALNEFDTTLSRATSFEAVGAYVEADVTIGSAPDARVVTAGYASPAFFRALRVMPAAGRVFTQADVDSSQPLVILSQALWRRQFPDGRITDARISVDGIDRLVVGVMPPGFSYSFVGIGADLWIPLGRASRSAPAIVTVYARLRDGVGWPAATAELSGLSAGRAPWTWRAVPIQEDTRKRAVAAYSFTLGPALLVLLIACINVACMLMARGLERDKELSVRRALGATRGRVIRVLLTENLLLALISGALGGVLALAILRVLAHAFAAVQPALAAQLSGDIGLLPVAVVSSTLACLLFGTVPALRLSRRDVAASLNGVPPVHRLEIAGYGGRDAIVFAEVASAVGLIVWSAMVFTLFSQLRGVTLAFPADHVVAMRVPGRAMPAIAQRLAIIPGVIRVTSASGMLGGGSAVRVQAEGGRAVVMASMPVGEGFLETLGIPLIRGRGFDATELHAASGVAILTESAARQLAPDGNVVGARIQINSASTAVVIGVCRDAIDSGFLSRGGLMPPDIYVPYEASADDVVALARVSSDAHAALVAISAAARTPAGSRPARPVVLSDDWKFRDPLTGMIGVRVLGAFAILALLLAASGVFAVIGQSVAQRTREFGIRMALGAAPRRVLGMVLAREARLIAAAIGTGVVFAMGLTRALFVELSALSVALPWMWIAALALSAAVATLACAVATYRIVRLEPSVVLRRS
ncbi:MAG TPA: ABC transporter permease [Vicinamibacterales bacterium]|nr:ABC transporter permease [Vicinamibacterales bacterium]